MKLFIEIACYVLGFIALIKVLHVICSMKGK